MISAKFLDYFHRTHVILSTVSACMEKLMEIFSLANGEIRRILSNFADAMRIIHLVRSNSWGGGERYALDLCRRLVTDGHDVTVVTRGAKCVDERFIEAGIPVEHMPLGGFIDFRTPVAMARMIMRENDDRVVIHVHNFVDAELVARAKMLVGKRKKVRLVCTRHLVRPGKSSARWRWIFGAIDRVVFVSEFAEKVFLSTDPPVDHTRLRVIPNSVVIPERYRHPESVELHEGIRLLYTGRIHPEKGIDVLIRAIAGLSDLPVSLRVCGTGSEAYTGELKDLASRLGVSERVEWAGFTEDVFAEICRADICVAPSVGREAFGLTLLEFMSQGKAVVASSNGAQPEIITDGEDGMLVEAGSAGELENALRSLMVNPEIRNRIAENARRTFEKRFAYEKFYKRILSVYAEGAIERDAQQKGVENC